MDKSAPYLRIAEHFDEGIQGALKVGDDFSEAFIDYLKLLYTPEETMKLKQVERSEPFPGPGDLYRTVAKENRGIEA